MGNNAPANANASYSLLLRLILKLLRDRGTVPRSMVLKVHGLAKGAWETFFQLPENGQLNPKAHYSKLQSS